MTRFSSRIGNWLASRVPTREQLEGNRWLRPFAHLVLRPELWRLNRRSVPRGVALGLFTGIMVPFAHSVVAALTSVFARANVPVAIVTTWTSNPFTWVIMFPAAAAIGNRLGLHLDMGQFQTMLDDGATLSEWVHWLASTAAPPILLGLFVEAVVASALGYLVAGFVWARWIRAKRRRDLAGAAQRRLARETVPHGTVPQETGAA